tara:strand:+ start:3115 stop:3771 length:657 start_codon:yes stop_codon:yes gene_type:complete
MTEAENQSGDDPVLGAIDSSVEKDVDAISSLDNLKGKTLDDDTFERLADLVAKKVESTADKRVTDARKSWESSMDKKLESGDYYTATDVQNMIDKNNQQLERKAEARNQFIDTLAEINIKPTKGTEGYDNFTKAYNEGLDKGDWTPEILRSRAGIRTIAATAGLVGGGETARGQESDAKPLNMIPSQGIPIVKPGEDGKVPMTHDEKVLEKMRKAIGE